MASVEEVITELKRLRPEQVDEAVQHGWPAEFFTELIGSLPELERSAQPLVDNRADL